MDFRVSGFGEWLRETCRAEGLSLREAAAKAGLSHSTIADIVKGSSPTPETIKRLAHTFGGNGRQKLALEDSLLILAGHRTERPNGEDLRRSLAKLVDTVSGFSDAKIDMVTRFAEFVAELEKEK
jgi:transcriptional regulator with XRE-family HTH domain